MATGSSAAYGHRPLAWRVRLTAPVAAVLVLHGGEVENEARPGPVNLPGLRMGGFVRAVARATAGAQVAVGVVRYRHRGWNGERADAARDATAALGDLAEELGPVPTVLIGHSMGGRAALRAAAHPCVTGVVALAPWCPDEDPHLHLKDRQLLTLHGDRDRVTDPAETRRFAARARTAGAQVAGYTVHGSGHTLLHRASDWHRATAGFTSALLGLRPMPGAAAAALALKGDDPGGLELALPRRITTPPVPRLPAPTMTA
ncbi:alpha/beta family hydrolase [Kitasatospora sp. GP82]|uniref:serine aminopeptidase domain-containing protein n=1 Tax=Kitasatospora sp. GP82 TaxID=3035089 RepID=UPI002473CD23|nr:alpha/beta family hydrolase [Kitasatospora sp. GP82]MDH6127461.1 putative esterase [Kitasatospora sp. GP82]